MNKIWMTRLALIFRLMSLAMPTFLLVVGAGSVAVFYAASLPTYVLLATGLPLLVLASMCFLFWSHARAIALLCAEPIISKEKIIIRLRTIPYILLLSFLCDVIGAICAPSLLDITKTAEELRLPMWSMGHMIVFQSLTGLAVPTIAGANALFIALIAFAVRKSMEHTLVIERSHEQLLADSDLTI
jgi:hypothetical protein